MSPTFAELGVPDSICAALTRRGIDQPFEIQAATIADALAGRDVCGRAPTGSGKTLAFGIPLVATVSRARAGRPRALVLAPTRELADQIHTELRSFSGPIKIGVVYGGVGYGGQRKSLRQGVEILVACPGRLEDLIEQGDVDLAEVDKVVLDEADRMADMGFMPAVRRLLDQTKKKRQTVLFSATLDGDVAKLTRDYQHNPVRHEVGEETPDITAASHVFWNVARTDRTQVAAEAINAVWPAIVFCRTRHGSDRLAKQLAKQGVQAATIHGGRSQNQRTRALSDFAKGRVHALVATDVAARGIHVDGVASVVHYDPPEDHKTYVHRSGRTARAGEGGVVVSLVQPEQERDLRRMQKKIGLGEPFTSPDAAALRAMSPAPSRTLTRPEPGEETESREGGNDRRGGGYRKGGRRPNSSKPRGGSSARRGKPGAGKSGNGGRSRGSGGNSSGGSGSGRTGEASSGSRSQGPSGNRRGKQNSGGSKGSGGGQGSGSGRSKSGGPNRKQRRAHMQPK